MSIRQDFENLRRREGLIDPADLDAMWSRLHTMRIEELTGQWRGSAFDTGHRTSKILEKSGWYGKRFDSPLDVQPLICRNAEGELYSDTESGRGGASLWMVEFRGESTATMVYDGMAVFDHFKKVDDGTVMGIMNGKGIALDEGKHFYFLLDRD